MRGMKYIIALGVCILLMAAIFLQKAVKPFVPDFDKMTEIMVLTPSYPGWRGRFAPNGKVTLSSSGGDIRHMGETAEASFTFKETYDLVAPHLKQGGYQYINELGDALVIRFYFEFDDLEGKEFYIDDKETMRKLMHGLCDKILSSPDSFILDRAFYKKLLSKYPLVPGDPPYLKADEEATGDEGEVIGDAEPFAPDFDKMTEIVVFTPFIYGWTGKFVPNGSARLSYSGNIRHGAKTVEASFTFKETYTLVAPHLKQGGYQYVHDNELQDALVIRFYFGLDDPKGKEFYIDDKETMRKLMHGLCDKILSSPDSIIPDRAEYKKALRTHPLVPGDPPYLQADEEVTGDEGEAGAGMEKLAMKRSLEFWYWENGKRNATYRTMTAKAIRMDSDSAEAYEYSRIARTITATPSITIPGDVAPTVDMHGEWAIVTFPYINDIDENWKRVWSDYYAEVIIETKTKAVLAIMLNEDLENKDARDAGDFAPLIAESKAAPTTWNTFKDDDEDVEGIYSYVAPKRIRLDPGSEKVAEYVRIADAEAKRRKIPDDVVPTAVVQGDNIVVSFPWRPSKDIPKEQWHLVKGPSFFAEVVIDIKTKAVLDVIN